MSFLRSNRPAILRWSAASMLVAAALASVLWAQRASTEEELWRHRNLGKAYFETPVTVGQAPEELKKALDLAPNSVRDRINYGLALLRGGDIKAAIAELERAQKQAPAIPHTWFNLGIAYKREGRHADAIRQFERMTKLAPDEPVSHYNLGLLYQITGKETEALREFQIAAKLDPAFVAPRFQIFNFYRLRENEEAAARALAEFREVKQQQQQFEESEDVEWSFYAELYDPTEAHTGARDKSEPAALKFEDHAIAGISGASGFLVLDADRDHSPDLLVWSRSGAALYRNGRDAVASSGLDGLTEISGVAAGDFDNDGLPDLCVLTPAGPRILHNAKGRFEAATVTLPAGRYETAFWLDYDHDYDADLYLLGSKSVLLRNEGQAGFAQADFPFVEGKATSAAGFRLIPDAKGFDLAVTYADRPAVLYRDRLRGRFEPVPLAAVPAGATGLAPVDIDNDSWMDLAFASPAGVSIAVNRSGAFQTRPVRGASGPFAFADLENRGLADLAAKTGVLRNDGAGQLTAIQSPPELPESAAWAAADFDSDGRTDLAVIAANGAPHVLFNRATTRNDYIRIALTGVKNLKSGAHAEVEVKAGNVYQKRIYEAAPIVFGLGPHKLVDTVRITWPNGLVQNEPNQRTARTASIQEAPRLSGSCPMIFTWNGRGFEFITDVLGVAPLGASSGDGQFFPVDHDEYVRIPAESLAQVNGRYQIRITEELHEVSYLDQIRLFALDRPAGVEVYTNEKFKSPPFPEFRLFGVSRRIRPVRAYDDRGADTLGPLLRRDRQYARGFKHDHSGVAETHSLTLDFGGDAPRGNSAVLLLNGWVDWADGSTFLNASQGKEPGLILPYLQVKDAHGVWRTVVEDMGIPAGKPKTIAVDLTGRFLSASREVRIVTNLCVYWDEVFLSEDAGAPQVRLTPIHAETADLRLRGFSRPTIHPRREQPEQFEYASWMPQAMWSQTPGMYTRYGEVRELVHTVDDRFVIMGAGDELRLSFDASSLPPIAPGHKRDFLLLVDGWAKDADANTAFSQSVEPLPFHGMTRYPYPETERYPSDALHREYQRTYNTRPAVRLMTPLVAGRR